MTVGDALHLPVERFRLHCHAIDPITLPPYAGSALRGLFGHALKRLVCITREPDCRTCALYRTCIHPYIFETPPPSNTERMRLYPAAPHPYVIVPPLGGTRDLAADAAFDVEVVLIGQAIQHLSLVVQAFEAAGTQGIGSARQRFRVASVMQEDRAAATWTTIGQGEGALTPVVNESIVPPLLPAGSVELTFVTPLRLTRDGKVIGQRPFEFHDLYRNLLRRIASLAYFHGERELDVDFRALAADSRHVTLTERNLEWFDWTRYSSRQRTKMHLGGLVGHVKLESTDLARFWPYIWLGQWIHAGKNTTMGLGKYRVASA